MVIIIVVLKIFEDKHSAIFKVFRGNHECLAQFVMNTLAGAGQGNFSTRGQQNQSKYTSNFNKTKWIQFPHFELRKSNQNQVTNYNNFKTTSIIEYNVPGMTDNLKSIV